MERRADLADKTAIGLSFICVIHCVGISIVAATLPALSAAIPFEHWVHDFLFWIAVPISALALVGGIRQHRKLGPSLYVVAGLFTMFLGFFTFHETPHETWMSIVGAGVVAVGHVMNYRLLRHGHGAKLAE